MIRSISWSYTCIFIIGCTSAQFTCANGRCVPISARCNGVNECGDNSDEQNCSPPGMSQTDFFLQKLNITLKKYEDIISIIID